MGKQCEAWQTEEDCVSFFLYVQELDVYFFNDGELLKNPKNIALEAKRKRIKRLEL